MRTTAAAQPHTPAMWATSFATVQPGQLGTGASRSARAETKSTVARSLRTSRYSAGCTERRLPSTAQALSLSRRQFGRDGRTVPSGLAAAVIKSGSRHLWARHSRLVGKRTLQSVHRSGCPHTELPTQCAKRFSRRSTGEGKVQGMRTSSSHRLTVKQPSTRPSLTPPPISHGLTRSRCTALPVWPPRWLHGLGQPQRGAPSSARRTPT